MTNTRLKNRQRHIWAQDYLHYKYLWPNIKHAVSKARELTNSLSPIVLDIGCGEKPYADLFDGTKYFGINYGTLNSSPDVVGNALNVPICDGSVDIIFSTQVIEHVPNPFRMVEECARILKPGGFLILTGPFYWPLHEEPHDYFRFTKYGFAHLLKSADLESIEIKADGSDWAQILLSINLRFPGRFWSPLRGILNIFEIFIRKTTVNGSSPANYTVLARKPVTVKKISPL